MTDSKQQSATDKPATPASEHRGNSRATIERSISLNSTPATKVFNRHFGVVSANLYQIGVMVPVRSAPEIAEHLEEKLNEYFKQAEDGLSKESDRIHSIMESNGIDSEPSYTHPSAITVDITTPDANRFLHLIETLDRVCLLIDNVWLNGLFTNVQRNRALYNAQQRVARCGGRVRNLHNSVKSVLAKGKNATLNDLVVAGHEAKGADQHDEDDDAADEAHNEANAAANSAAPSNEDVSEQSEPKRQAAGRFAAA